MRIFMPTVLILVNKRRKEQMLLMECYAVVTMTLRVDINHTVNFERLTSLRLHHRGVVVWYLVRSLCR